MALKTRSAPTSLMSPWRSCGEALVLVWLRAALGSTLALCVGDMHSNACNASLRCRTVSSAPCAQVSARRTPHTPLAGLAPTPAAAQSCAR
jgi:hypothetical protein